MSVLVKRPAGARTDWDDDGPDPDAPWRRWQDWASLLVGLWLWSCSGIFDALGNTGGGAAAATSVIAGTILVGVSIWALAEPAIREIEGILAVAALWLIMTPSMFDFIGMDPIGAINNWAIGVIGFVLAIWALMDHAVANVSRG